MNERDVIRLAHAFLEPTFGLDAVRHQFASVGAVESHGGLTFRTTANGVASVTVEPLAPDGDEARDVAGLVIELAGPTRMDLDVIAQHFGAYGEMPRLKPEQDVPCRFLLASPRYTGILILNVAASESLVGRVPVSQIILRRFPREE